MSKILGRMHKNFQMISKFAQRRFSSTASDLAVVRIMTTRQRPSWTVPWQMRSVEASSGSGAIIPGNGKIRILTAAHVVADSTYLTVQRNTDYFDSEKFPARVLAQFHDTDLALLEIDDADGAFSSIKPMSVAAPSVMPALRSKVNVVGYPVGGDRVSVTEGVVSRVDIAKYSHSGRFACSFTVDAAINAGNSGGPIVDPAAGNIIGVAFQKLVGSGVENQGHGVPPYLIWRFLNGVARNAGADELPSLGIAIQPLESPALRTYLGAASGILVNWSMNPAIKQHDVITAVNGHRIDNQGLTQFLGRRIHFGAVLHELFVGDTVELEILRAKQPVTVEARLLGSSAVDLVPSLQYAKRPEYLVVGGLVFQPLSLDFLQGWNERDRPCHLQEILNKGRLGGEQRQAVILTNVLAARCNAGYSSGWVGGPVLKAVNGTAVKDLAHLADLVDAGVKSASEEFIKFTITGYVDDQLVVLNKQDVVRDDPLIQATYDIPRLRNIVSS